MEGGREGRGEEGRMLGRNEGVREGKSSMSVQKEGNIKGWTGVKDKGKKEKG